MQEMFGVLIIVTLLMTLIKLRSTIGINTSWISPAGPLSFIFSNNITKASTDVDQSFNFRLGTTF